MIAIERILCPIDFSDYSRHALDHALALGRAYHAAVTAVHVIPLLPAVALALPSEPLPVITMEDREAVKAAMRTFCATATAPAPPPDIVLREGRAADEILAAAGALRSSLIVMGTHGRSGFDRFILGSVAERVLRKSPCPVLIVPPRAPDTAAAAVAFRHILCATDFSACATHALNAAASLAERTGARLTVLHVVELPGLSAELKETAMADPHHLSEYIAFAEADARAYLQETTQTLLAGRGDIDMAVATGKPYKKILDAAAERKADLIVVGIHGRNPIDRLFFGSTANQIVRQASCPVLSIRTE